MLPDYVDTKELLQDFLDRWLRRRVREHLGALGEIPHYRIFEGTGASIIRSDSREDITNMQKMESEFSMRFDEVPSMSFPEILKRLDGVAQNMADQIAKHTYNTISEVTERVGNVVKSTGKITTETLIEVFEKIEIIFDDKGEPQLPTIHIHPNMTETLKEAIFELQNNPEHRKRFEEILTRKRESWRVREANRRLVG
jgi:hypothetical protein